MNKTNGPTIGCEIELKDGRICGIPPIGRCATCERAFCATHQGWDDGTLFHWSPYVNMCVPCYITKRGEAIRRQEEARAPYMYFKSGAAQTDLHARGVPPVKIYSVEEHWKRSFFGEKRVEDVTHISNGWILGEFKWSYLHGTHEGSKVIENCLTALLDLSPESLARAPSHGFARVQHYSGDYKILTNQYHGPNGWEQKFLAWEPETSEGYRAAMQTVKRLIGESS